ncbi:hypothetical protein QCD70_15845 [Agreia sp. PsM10]|uniref:hypothetical protein n=1 Tax=Agreia sp. PsM10 TaxID=3030533 RepID=UPI00263BAB99|nr:hypothetical protein [Agreia sp. PsM10]MDN4641724.1 hypothetical protein [Agreia sp. PsM10]
MRDEDAAVGEPTTPDYGAPTGADANLPLYGSKDSVVPIEHAVSDFDPKAAANVAARARAATRRAREAADRRRAKEARAEASVQAFRERRAREAQRAQARIDKADQARAERFRLAGRDPATLRPRVARRSSAARDRSARRRRLWGVAGAFILVAGVGTGLVVANLPESPPTSISDGLDWSSYPGVSDGESPSVLINERQEQIIAADTALVEAMAEALSEETGLGWNQSGIDTLTRQENDWGGTSMLSEWRSADWYTTEPITDLDTKARIIERARFVLAEHGYDGVQLVNDPVEGQGYNLDSDFGGSTLATQVIWRLQAKGNRFTDFELTITDLSRDTDGRFARAASETERQGGVPPNSVHFAVRSDRLLAASDEREFNERREPFVRKKAPPPF